MFFMIRTFLLIFTFSIAQPALYADDNGKKEEKNLIKFIKTDYYSWTNNYDRTTESEDFPDYDEQTKAPAELSVGKALKRESRQGQAYSQAADFRDFQCTIVDSQAIVQFTVDTQRISAFFEKENGVWKLICAAQIDDPA